MASAQRLLKLLQYWQFACVLLPYLTPPIHPSAPHRTPLHPIAPQHTASCAELTGGFDSEVLRLYYSSMSTPPSVYDQHLGSGELLTLLTLACMLSILFALLYGLRCIHRPQHQQLPRHTWSQTNVHSGESIPCWEGLIAPTTPHAASGHVPMMAQGCQSVWCIAPAWQSWTAVTR